MKVLRSRRFTIAVAALLLAAGTSGALAAPKNELLTSNGNGIAVSTQPLADKAGQDVLDRGGNAIDAAVAVGYALAVLHLRALLGREPLPHRHDPAAPDGDVELMKPIAASRPDQGALQQERARLCPLLQPVPLPFPRF